MSNSNSWESKDPGSMDDTLEAENSKFTWVKYLGRRRDRLSYRLARDLTIRCIEAESRLVLRGLSKDERKIKESCYQHGGRDNESETRAKKRIKRCLYAFGTP